MEHLVSLLRKNKLLAAALVAELAVVVWLAAGLFGPAYRLSLTPDAFSNGFPGFAALTEDGSALQIYNNNGFTSDKEITFSTAGVALPSGAYEVTVDYFSCQTPDAPTFSVQQSAGSLTFASDKVPSAVQADTLTLDDGHRTVTTPAVGQFRRPAAGPDPPPCTTARASSTCTASSSPSSPSTG